MAINYQNVPNTTVPRDFRKLEKETGNLYESIAIISKRANQIAASMKEELHGKLNEFNNDSDTLEEVFENREQIEISMHYERLPKPTLIATEEFLSEKVYHRNPEKEKRFAEGSSI
ncbi:MAG: DNA-directed RNA polymerase subunit omega [Bacteroidetes bacterium]|nr:DNA-directed RNA polymerase subunit omega [Bacteroidota bacterium]MCK6610075.1 DNA-directed RNA polymerase subunit omega [Bacteroidia bacterium]